MLSVVTALLLAGRQTPQEFHVRAQESTGIIVPLYVYPTNIANNSAYTRLIDVKRRYETVPIWVIVNPNSGPGSAVDTNYVTAINRLRGGGCVVIGYIPTNYGKRSVADVESDVAKWMRWYPNIQGLFFDEMSNSVQSSAVAYQQELTQYSHNQGLWPIVANPGTDTPPNYFAPLAADVFVVHEDSKWPVETNLQTRYVDSPAFTRAVLVHSQSSLNTTALKMVRKYAKWVYVTEDQYRPGDPKAPNPWDTLSKHLEDMCKQIVAR